MSGMKRFFLFMLIVPRGLLGPRVRIRRDAWRTSLPDAIADDWFNVVEPVD